jgi:hypothetical protein
MRTKRSRLIAGLVLLVLAVLTILFLKADFSSWLATGLGITGLALILSSKGL